MDIFILMVSFVVVKLSPFHAAGLFLWPLKTLQNDIDLQLDKDRLLGSNNCFLYCVLPSFDQLIFINRALL